MISFLWTVIIPTTECARITSTGEKLLNPAATWRFTMPLTDLRTPPLRLAFIDSLRRSRLATASITSASPTLVHSRYSSEREDPGQVTAARKKNGVLSKGRKASPRPKHSTLNFRNADKLKL